MSHNVPEEVWLWLDEEQSGPFTPREILDLCRDGYVDRNTLYFEPAVNEWRPLAQLYEEEKQERLAYLRSAGIGAVQIAGGGQDDECPACRELLDKIFPIADAPIIPPENCTCEPWCKAVYIASR
jgi:GYF domain 2